jgi:hypothetical protein
MSISKWLFLIWVKLSLLSVLVDVACYWLVEHNPAAVPGSKAPNYLMIFTASVPAPIVLAIVLTLVWLFLKLSWALLRWIWKTLHRKQRQVVARPSPTLASTTRPGLDLPSFSGRRNTNGAAVITHSDTMIGAILSRRKKRLRNEPSSEGSRIVP